MGASCEGQSTTNACALLGVHGEALYLRSLRTRVRNDERRKRVELPFLPATSDERAHVEARKERVAVHRAEWDIQAREDEITWVYDELPEGGQ